MRVRRFQVSPIFLVNVYVVSCEETGEAMIVDPGGGFRDVTAYVADNRLRVRNIAVTHYHPDHVAALRRFRKSTGASIVAHPASERERHSAMMRAVSVGGLLFRPDPPDVAVGNGMELSVGSLRFRVEYSPGHTEDGICLVGEGAVFTGDTIMMDGVGRTDLAGGSFSKLKDSVERVIFSLPDETRMLPGHGPETTVGREKRANPFFT